MGATHERMGEIVKRTLAALLLVGILAGCTGVAPTPAAPSVAAGVAAVGRAVGVDVGVAAGVAAAGAYLAIATLGEGTFRVAP